MKAFSIKNTDTTFTDVKAVYSNSPSDSILYFYLPAKTDTACLQLNALDINTLSLTYGVTMGRCCTFTSIKAANYNNSDLIQTKDSVVELRK